ncbi:hypothetical protein [Blastopirellula retiformator]|uniref:Lipoprotein n=1 Tax=Blastopirellula retiformator TaxID=2527970 RepID=A0A5C5V120_9BACT|nr:hypothetical protein [Blastopirellula retiformator]TWT31663.1 hypothetical protein Enr8_35870 [Blastopirellula retiformator]
MSTFQNFRHACRVAAACLAVSLLAAGCSSKEETLQTISGRVTYQGNPVPIGVIQFSPDAAAGNQGMVGFAEIKEGKFNTAESGRGVESGPLTVSIDAYSMQNVQPDITPHGKALVIGYKQKITVEAGTPTELDLEIGPQRR